MSTSETIYVRWGKRALDLGLGIVLLVLLAPIMAVIALLVRLKLGSPVIFVQERPGLGGRTFRLLKFRTMTSECDSTGNLLPDEQRIVALGKVIRSLSIDELPELWNVIRGDMSLVGPRPLLVEYLPRYSPEQARRHSVRPGLTGWAQVHGRNSLSWQERFELDVWYVDHVSFRLDVSILSRTLFTVVRREGISADGDATMPPFSGEGG